jgi:hypothetical protein
VRAVFRRRGDTFELSLELRGSDHLRLMEWRREERISEALLEAEVNDDLLPGDYDLVAVRGRGVAARTSGPTELEVGFPAGVPRGGMLPDRRAEQGSGADGHVPGVSGAFVSSVHPTSWKGGCVGPFPRRQFLKSPIHDPLGETCRRMKTDHPAAL